jgi:hypothetical protein
MMNFDDGACVPYMVMFQLTAYPHFLELRRAHYALSTIFATLYLLIYYFYLSRNKK